MRKLKKTSIMVDDMILYVPQYLHDELERLAKSASKTVAEYAKTIIEEYRLDINQWNDDFSKEAVAVLSVFNFCLENCSGARKVQENLNRVA